MKNEVPRCVKNPEYKCFANISWIIGANIRFICKVRPPLPPPALPRIVEGLYYTKSTWSVCPFVRTNWLPPPPLPQATASVPPLGTKRGQHSLAGANSDEERKHGNVYTLCPHAPPPANPPPPPHYPNKQVQYCIAYFTNCWPKILSHLTAPTWCWLPLPLSLGAAKAGSLHLYK